MQKEPKYNQHLVVASLGGDTMRSTQDWKNKQKKQTKDQDQQNHKTALNSGGALGHRDLYRRRPLKTRLMNIKAIAGASKFLSRSLLNPLKENVIFIPHSLKFPIKF